MMKGETTEYMLSSLESRVAALEHRVFGEEINSKIQQQRKVVEELVQVNGQIQRGVANRETVSTLLRNIEEMIDFLDLEESSQLLGGEAKGNAVLAAEPIIRQMHAIVKGINLDQIHQAINSEAIRNVTSLSGQLAQLKLVQIGQEEKYRDLSTKIDEVEEVISILGLTLGK